MLKATEARTPAFATAATGAPPSQIAVGDLGMRYRSQRGDTVEALRDVAFSIAPGEFAVVVGPSGCGKSTLLKLIAGLARPTHGTICIEGSPVTGPRVDVGIVFQNPVLFPWRTVLENVLLPADARGLSRKAYQASAHALLDLVGLGDSANRYAFELSGGMQQRNALARALLLDPHILLMDEPFAALDAMTREQMNLELLRVWEQSRKTVFFITHSIPEAVLLADRVLVMSARPGRIAAAITVDLPRPRTLEVLGTAHFAELTQHVRGSLEGATWRP